VESIEFDIASGYASSSKVPALSVSYEGKWECYVQQLSDLDLPHTHLSRFLEKVCSPPCHPSTAPVRAWRSILPCLGPSDWGLPIACWNETEKALRNEKRRSNIERGLERLAQFAPHWLGPWLRLAPYNLCREAHRLGSLSAERAQKVLERAAYHPIWQDLQQGAQFHQEGWRTRWTPLTVPEWLSEGLAQSRPLASLVGELLKRQPLLQLELLYRLLRS
jgi:hypothetical protein